MPDLNIQLEQAQMSEQDARLVMEWRNNPHTLSMFYDQRPKIWNSFWNEFCEKYFVGEAKPYFASINGKKVAFLRSMKYPENLTNSKNCYDIDINISPENRGMGYAKQILRMFSQKIVDMTRADCIVAEVKKINPASIKSFEGAGFQYFDEMIKKAYGSEYEIVRLVKRYA